MKKQITILQVESIPENRHYMFTSLSMMKRLGQEVELNRYEKVFESEMEFNSDEMIDVEGIECKALSFPDFRFDMYVPRLVGAGYKVAAAEEWVHFDLLTKKNINDFNN